MENFNRPTEQQRDEPEHNTITEKLAQLGVTDSANAERFAERMKEKLRYCTDSVSWYRWTGKRWKKCQPDRVLKYAMRAANKIADEAEFLPNAAERAERQKFCQRARSRASLENMVYLARSLLAVHQEDFDKDPWLFNVKNGTIHLRTGKLKPHNPANLITKISMIKYDPDAKCPNFKQYLKHALPSKGLRTCLQRSTGYTLTGDTREQKFFLAEGPALTGKSVYISCVMRLLLGEYGAATSSNTFMIKSYDNNIPNDLAALCGKRGIMVSEVNAGKHFDEARIKSWTGGDPQTARFMRGEFFTFQPEGKLWLALNDLPRVRESDGAFWRRVRIFPFHNQVPKDEVNLQLPSVLEAELPGILAWAVRGCLKWQKSGLKEDSNMVIARKGYQSKMDHFEGFFRACCELVPDAEVGSQALFDAYEKWCYSAKEHPFSQKQFKAKMQDRNLTYRRLNSGRVWAGVRLLSAAD